MAWRPVPCGMMASKGARRGGKEAGGKERRWGAKVRGRKGFEEVLARGGGEMMVPDKAITRIRMGV
jgi:hypothetical protein